MGTPLLAVVLSEPVASISIEDLKGADFSLKLPLGVVCFVASGC